jgi:uncharacterized membrane protein
MFTAVIVFGSIGLVLLMAIFMALSVINTKLTEIEKNTRTGVDRYGRN